MQLTDLPTPSLILDRRRLAQNVSRMRARADQFGVTLRPHLKTAKSARVAELATGGKGPIAVSTLAEAAYFLKHGFRDITYAVGVVPAKLDQVAALQRDGADLKLITDNVDVARTIAARRRTLGQTVPLLIEIATGLGRAGVAPESPEISEIARALSTGAAELAGVLAPAGHSYHCHGVVHVKRGHEQF